MERVKGFEPSTPTLARLCSTPELHSRNAFQVRENIYIYKLNASIKACNFIKRDQLVSEEPYNQWAHDQERVSKS